jgi:hypothetical protein
MVRAAGVEPRVPQMYYIVVILTKPEQLMWISLGRNMYYIVVI